jgi:hypothetical protein
VPARGVGQDRRSTVPPLVGDLSRHPSLGLAFQRFRRKPLRLALLRSVEEGDQFVDDVRSAGLRCDIGREQGMVAREAPFKPMTLRNMRQNGVRAVIATCQACGHKADVNVDALAGTVIVPNAGRQLRLQQMRREADRDAARVAYGVIAALSYATRLKYLGS